MERLPQTGGNQIDPGFASTGGSGGAIRLVAPVITGSNALITARGGAASGGASAGQDGRIRVEAFKNDLRGDVNGTPLSIGKPFKLFLPPDPPPSVTVLSVGGVRPKMSPDASPAIPKVSINQGGPVVIGEVRPAGNEDHGSLVRRQRRGSDARVHAVDWNLSALVGNNHSSRIVRYYASSC